MRRKSKAFAQIENLELRRLLSTIYVSAAAPAGGAGTSWLAAFQTLQSGLSAAALVATSSNPVVIKVGQGAYLTGGKTSTFQLLDHVAIDGGYAGYGQTNPDARAPATYPSVLSGQLGSGGAANSYHVVTGSGTNSTAILDGFTITDGNANGSSIYHSEGAGVFDNAGSPSLNDCVITGNTAVSSVGSGNGGGMFNYNGSSPTLTDCTISGNTATSVGGGIFNRNHSSPTLINCTISGNTASSGSGGIYNGLYSSPLLTDCTISGNTTSGYGGGMDNVEYSSPVLTNCTLSGNTASQSGGGIANSFNDYPALTNCILWGDTAKTSGNEISTDGGTVTITYSDIEQSGFTGTGDLDTDPKFIRNSGTLGANDFGDLRLLSSSPAINAGSNSAVSVGVITDADGLSRIAGGHVDMGAYESHWAFQSTIYVDATATGAGTGTDWADAYPSLAAALDYAVSGETMDVAQGIYKPAVDTNRFDTFQLVSGVNIEGGFAGQVNPTAAQNIAAYPTTLSGILGGDINTAAGSKLVNSFNSYHVVTGSGTTAAAILNGFTIIGGNANGSSNHFNDGGGILDISCSPTVSNCTLTGNIANDGGAIANYSSSPNLNNCTLSGNSTFGESGQLYNGNGSGMFDDASSPTLTNCILSGNTASRDGGALYNTAECNLTLNDCTLSENSAAQSGGGMESSGSSATMTGCIVTGNTAILTGGGIDGSGSTLTNCAITGNTARSTGGGVSGSATLTNCTVSGNTAAVGGGGIAGSGLTLINCTLSGNMTNGSGGGIAGAGLTLTNCTITGNTTGGGGEGGGIYNSGSATLTNCTISGNTAAGGGGIYGGRVGATLTNCILWGDAAGSGNEARGILTITYSDIAGGYVGTGNINADPMFIRSVGTNGATDYGDLHLQFTSPAIDAGSNSAVPAGVTTDLDGNPRIFDFPGANNGAGAVVDMGAYELGYNLDEVIVPANKTVALSAGGYPFSASQLIIGTGGTLDVADDYLTINYANVDPASSIAALISTGYANGNWTGTGIISSNTLGEPANSTGVGDYDNGTQVKIGRTWDGDANVDGVINADDLSLIMLGQANRGARWQDGNFNYGTQVNADDWMKLMYAVAISKGQTRPSVVVINTAAPNAASVADGITSSEMNTSISPASQTLVPSDDEFSDILESPGT